MSTADPDPIDADEPLCECCGGLMHWCCCATCEGDGWQDEDRECYWCNGMGGYWACATCDGP